MAAAALSTTVDLILPVSSALSIKAFAFLTFNFLMLLYYYYCLFLPSSRSWTTIIIFLVGSVATSAAAEDEKEEEIHTRYGEDCKQKPENATRIGFTNINSFPRNDKAKMEDGN